MTSNRGGLYSWSNNFELSVKGFRKGGEVEVLKRIFDTRKKAEKLVENKFLTRSSLNKIIRSYSVRIRDLSFKVMPTVLFEDSKTDVDITKIVRAGGIGRISHSDMKIAMLTSGKPSSSLIEKFNGLLPVERSDESIHASPIPIGYAMENDYSASNEIEIIVFQNSYNVYGDASNFRVNQKFFDVLDHTAVFWTKNEDNINPKEDPKLQAYYALKNDLRRYAPNLINRFLMVPLHSFPSYYAYKESNHTSLSVNFYKEQLSNVLRAFMRDNSDVRTIHLWIQGSVRMTGEKNFVFKMSNKDLCDFFLNEANGYLVNGVHSLKHNAFGSIVKHIEQVDGVVDGDNRFPYYLFEMIHAYDKFHDDVVEKETFINDEYHSKALALNDIWYMHTDYSFTLLMLIGFPFSLVRLLLEAMKVDDQVSSEIMRAKEQIGVKTSHSIWNYLSNERMSIFDEGGMNIALGSVNDLKRSFFKINRDKLMSSILIKLYNLENYDVDTMTLLARRHLHANTVGFFKDVDRKCIFFNIPTEVAEEIHKAGIPIAGIVNIDAASLKYNLSARNPNTLQPVDMKLISKDMTKLLTFAINKGINVFPTLFDAMQPGLVLATSGTGKSTFVSSMNAGKYNSKLYIDRLVLSLHNSYAKIAGAELHNNVISRYGDRRDNVIILALRTSSLYRMTHLSSSDSLLRLPSISYSKQVEDKVPDCIIPNTSIISKLMRNNRKALAITFNVLLVANFRKISQCMGNSHYEYLHLCPNVKLRCVNIGDLVTSETVDTFYTFHRLYGWRMYPIVRFNTLSDGMMDEAVNKDVKATLDIMKESYSNAEDLIPSLFIASWKNDVKGFAGLTAMAYRSVFKFGRNEKDLLTLHTLDCLNASGHALSALLVPKSILLHYFEEILFSNVSSPFSFPTNEPVTGRNFHSKEDYIAAIKFAQFTTTKIKDATTSRKEVFTPYVNEMFHRILMFEVVIQYLDR